MKHKWRQYCWIAGVACCGTVVFAATVMLAGKSPLEVGKLLFTGGGGRYGLSEALAKSIPILLCALAAAIPGRLGLVNIGGEGQFLLGAVGASLVALSLRIGNPAVLLLSMALAGAAFGSLWGIVVGGLKSLTRANEIVISLLLNYVAALIVLHLVHGPLKDPNGMGWPQSAQFPDAARLGTFPGSRVHITLGFAVIIALTLTWVAKRTTWGFSTKLVGTSTSLARYLQIRTGVYYLVGFALAGALAGIAGFAEVSAIHGRLREGISLGYGYAGFFVAWLCRHRFSWCVPTSYLFALFITGADALQIETDLPFSTVYIFQGVLFLVVLAAMKTKKRWGEV